MFSRTSILPEAELPRATDLLTQGRKLSREWSVQPGAFLHHHDIESELHYKIQAIKEKRIMQHAQIGYRDPAKSREAWVRIYESCSKQGVTVDRYGICLDWTMGLPRDARKNAPKGTGLILDDRALFADLANRAPVAPHFGDFVLGFPAALENTQAALSAGATTIGNLGQYFTFRLPYWDDDVATTRATVTALALIAAQPVPVLVHSNLDDGFAGQFQDLACVLGAALIEQYIVEKLIGGKISHCWGHHFTDPLARLSFHLALSETTNTTGSMIYGNTIAYRSSPAGNFASLANYLQIDIAGQKIAPTGHAINPVPVSENERIPDIDEIVDAQVFAHRLIEHSAGFMTVLDPGPAHTRAEAIIEGARKFSDNVVSGLREAGIDTNDCVEVMLSLRRLGARRLEAMYGPGKPDERRPGYRHPHVPSPLADELDEIASASLKNLQADQIEKFETLRPRVIVATTDVHAHGKLALEKVLASLGADLIDGGVSVDADDLARNAIAKDADAILVSTYNGIALSYFETLRGALDQHGSSMPVCIGGRLNQIPDGSNTSLPVDVTDKLSAGGAIICRTIEDVVPALIAAKRKDV